MGLSKFANSSLDTLKELMKILSAIPHKVTSLLKNCRVSRHLLDPEEERESKMTRNPFFWLKQVYSAC